MRLIWDGFLKEAKLTKDYENDCLMTFTLTMTPLISLLLHLLQWQPYQQSKIM